MYVTQNRVNRIPNRFSKNCKGNTYTETYKSNTMTQFTENHVGMSVYNLKTITITLFRHLKSTRKWRKLIKWLVLIFTRFFVYFYVGWPAGEACASYWATYSGLGDALVPSERAGSSHKRHFIARRAYAGAQWWNYVWVRGKKLKEGISEKKYFWKLIAFCVFL